MRNPRTLFASLGDSDGRIGSRFITCEIAIFAAGVMKSAEVILPYIESHVQKYAWTPWGKVKIRAAELGESAALLGAIPMAAQAKS